MDKAFVHRGFASRTGGLNNDRRGKIPFAYLAVILLFLISAVMVPVMQSGTRLRENVVEEVGFPLALDLQDIETDIEERAYYYTMGIIKDVTKDYNPDLNRVQRELDVRMNDYMDSHFPMKRGSYTIDVLDYEFKINTMVMNTTDITQYIRKVKEAEKPNVLWEDVKEIYAVDTFNKAPTLIAAYPRIDGYVHYNIYDLRRGVNIRDNRTFDRNLYVPLPILKRGMDVMRFSFGQRDGYATRIVRYILSTLAQYRTILGVGAGGYDGTSSDNPGEDDAVSDIITKKDVEMAVNIALILEMARNFRTYDIDIAKAIDNTYPSNYGKRMEKLIKDYVTNGSIDGADIVALYYGFERTSDRPIEVGKTMAQAIYSYAERYSYELFDLFWGHDAASQYHLVDPTLKEPIDTWDEVKNKGSDWAKGMVHIWLDKFRKWLGIPNKITQRQSQAFIAPMTVYYYRPPNPEIGDPGADGTYYVFGGSGVPNVEYHGGNWYIRVEAVDDTVLLVMGDNNAQDMRPEPFEITCWDDFGSTVGEKTYKYFLVGESLIKKHSDSPSSAYMDTLEYIIKSLDKAMVNVGNSASDSQNNGMLATMAHGIYTEVGSEQSYSLDIDPKDHSTIIYNTTKYLMFDSNGAYYRGLSRIGSKAADFNTRDQWFHDGAYHSSMDNTGKSDPDYLWALVKETVDLWYEAVLNLFWGGTVGASNPQAGPPIPPQLPPEEQVADGHTSPSSGDFQFRNDGAKDAYYRVMKDVWQHGTQATDRRYVWDESHWIGYPKPADPVTIAAVLAQAQAQWNDQTIWSTVLGAITSALEMTVGSGGLLLEITPTLKSNMDITTDSGGYADGANFYRFVADHIGARLIGTQSNPGRDNLVVNMTRFRANDLDNSGWLDRSVRGSMFRSIYDLNDIWNTEFLPYTMVGVEHYMYHGNKEECERNHSTMNENFHVILREEKDEGDKFLNDGDEITVQIEQDKDSRHYVDIQHGILKDRNNENMEPCETPFDHQFNITVKGSFSLSAWSERQCIVYNGVHQPVYLNTTIDIDLNFTLPLYTAWPLESYWNAKDVNYHYTRGWFGVSDKDTFEDPHLISRPLGEYIRGMKDVVDLVWDSDTVGTPAFIDIVDDGSAKRTNYSKSIHLIYRTFKDIMDTYGSDYLNHMSDIRNRFSTAEGTSQSQDSYDIRFYGMNCTLYSKKTAMDLNTSWNYTAHFELEGKFDINGGMEYRNLTYHVTIDSSSDTYVYSGSYDLNGETHIGKYKFEFAYTPENRDMNYVSLEDGGTPGLIHGIYIEHLAREVDLNVGFMLDGNYENFLRDALNVRSNIKPEAEDLITYLQSVLTYLYNDTYINALGSHTIFGLYFDIYDYKSDTNLRTSLCLWSRSSGELGPDAVRYYLGWLINNIRHQVYELGMMDIHPLMISYAYGGYAGFWANAGISVEDYNINGDGYLLYGNLPSNTMGVSDIGFYPEQFYMALGYYEGGNQWMWRGTVEGTD